MSKQHLAFLAVAVAALAIAPALLKTYGLYLLTLGLSTSSLQWGLT